MNDLRNNAPNSHKKLPLSVALALLACSTSGATGDLSVLVEAEDVIVDGLEPGDALENVRDGWAVDFQNYLVTLGEIELHLAAGAGDVHEDSQFVVDLARVPASGLLLWEFSDLEAARWDFNYHLGTASEDTQRHEDVRRADFDLMVESGWTYLIRGTLSQAGGQSCPPAAKSEPGERQPNGQLSGENPCYDAESIDFELGISAPTALGPCSIDGSAGVAIPDGGAQTVALTIHGDHLFFNGFPEGGEGGVQRLAQWLADCDLNLDGLVDRDELEAIEPDDLPELDDRYQLGGAPVPHLDTMLDYVTAQLKSQGHYQGEGECPIDGVSHDHDHEDEDEDDHED